jgi:hypothetical protein
MNSKLDILKIHGKTVQELSLEELSLEELLHNFCYIKMNNEIIVNFENYKIINNKIEKKCILNYLIFVIENVLTNHKTFIVHANIKKLTLLEIDKNKDFICEMSNILKIKFNNKLEKCIIYEGSYIFKQIYKLLSLFIDKDTLHKIQF